MRQWLGIGLLSVLPFLAWGDEALITLPSPRGADITQSYLWTSKTAAPKVIYLLFPGHPGVLNLRKDESGEIKFTLGGNFLIRSRHLFAGADSAAASLDAPSDEMGGFEDSFRTTPKPAQDIGAVIDDLKRRFPSARIAALGTSASVTGVAHLAKNLPRKIDAVVLTSSVTVASFRIGMWGIGRFDFSEIKQPLLFVHHLNDLCTYSPYRGVENLGHPLITVTGQDPPKSDPCQAKSAHGFLGREAQVVEAIRAWVEGKPFTKLIE